MPLQLPTQLHCNRLAVSVTFARVPAAQSVVVPHLPFTAGVTVHVALVALPQVPALQVNVADPPRQEAAFVRFTLARDRVVVAVAEQPLPHSSVFPEQGGSRQSTVEPPHLPSHRHVPPVSPALSPAKQPPPAMSHSPSSGVLPVQDCVSRSNGLGAGHSSLAHGQLTVRVRI